MDGYTIGNTGLPTIPKTVPGLLDYPFKWGPWLAPLGETILSHTVTVQDGLTFVSSAPDPLVPSTIVVFVEGGTNGMSYIVDCEIVTATRRDTRSIVINVVTRR